jgi:tellurite resistance protein TehA-like permease
VSFNNRSTSVDPMRQLPHRTIPASFFAIPLGLVALGIAWQTAESIWSEPKWVSDTLIWLGTTLWAFLLMSYLGKWLVRRADAMAEFEPPLRPAMGAIRRSRSGRCGLSERWRRHT